MVITGLNIKGLNSQPMKRNLIIFAFAFMLPILTNLPLGIRKYKITNITNTSLYVYYNLIANNLKKKF